MKHGVKVVLLLSLLFGGSCQQNDCGRGGPSHVNITGLTGANLLLETENYYSRDALPATTAVTYYNYGLQVTPQATYFSYQPQTKPRAGFFPAAYACSPVPPQPSEEIADIAVFSQADYRQANSTKVLAAGDTLNAVFEIYDYHSGRIVGLPDFLVDEKLAASETGFVLRPIVAPADPQAHQFTLHYRLTNGEFYTFTADSVTLTP